MSSFEQPPQPHEDEPPELRLIEGEGPNIWARTPAEFGLDKPITAELFAVSNLMRRFQLTTRTERIHGRRGVIETNEVQRTRRGAIVGEIYRRTLPRTSAELIVSLEQQALAEELIYEAEGYATDSVYQAALADEIRTYASSLLMQGFEAFSEAAWDFSNGIHEDLIRDAQRFGSYLIQINQQG